MGGKGAEGGRQEAEGSPCPLPWMLVAWVFVFALLSSTPSSAYTFLVTDSTSTGPAPFRWDPTRPLAYRIDRGDLSLTLKNADGAILVQSALDRWLGWTWKGQQMVDLKVQYLGLTDADITRANYQAYERQTVVIFDTDGSILNALMGGGTSGEVLGLGEVTETDDGQGLFLAGRATLNGSAVGKPGTGDFEATLVHELGHFLGLGHTYVGHELKNGDPTDDSAIPTMYPLALDDDSQMRTPEIDDYGALGVLYGNSAFQRAMGRVEGDARWSEGLPVIGGHIEVRSVSDPRTRLGAITGYLGDGTGGFSIVGVPPGDYRVSVESIPARFAGASGIGIYEPPTRDQFASTTYRSPSETADFTKVTVAAGAGTPVSFALTPEPLPAGLTSTRYSRLTQVPLRDAAITRDTLRVAQSVRIRDLSVFVDIAHQYIGDLKVSLSSPSGRTVALVANVGYSGNLIEATFTQQKVPDMARFVDEDASGTWTLVVEDQEAEDVGTLRRWWLTLLSGTGTTKLAADYSGDGKVDFEDFFLFAAAFGTKQGGAGFDPKFDMDGSGSVDFTDFFLFAADFGRKG